MAWTLTRGLTTVRDEFNWVFPHRDKASDGTVGDLAHQDSKSGHNPDRTGNAEYRDGDAKDEVRAIDIDRDLIPGSDVDHMERVVQFLVRKARNGAYIPFRYLIYKGRIWSETDRWQTRAYTGANRHDKHMHGSGKFTQAADEWTGSLGLATLIEAAPAIEEEDDMSFGLIELPLEYAYRSTGASADGQITATLIEREAELTFPVEPAGFEGAGAWKSKVLALSLAGDRPDEDGPEIVRVAIHDGAVWHVDFYEVVPRKRVKIAVPPPASDNAFTVSFGRVARANVETDGMRSMPSVNACWSITSK